MSQEERQEKLRLFEELRGVREKEKKEVSVLRGNRLKDLEELKKQHEANEKKLLEKKYLLA